MRNNRALRSDRILFVSTMDSIPWGGSEELWSRTAVELVSQGISVSAGIIQWSPPHPRVINLKERGVELWFRPKWYSLRDHPWQRLASHLRGGPTTYAIERLITARPAMLIVLSSGSVFPPIDLLELCVRKRTPFVTIGHSNWEGDWFDDTLAERYRSALAHALRCFFVSRGNWQLAEKQIASHLSNAEVVWNPVNIPLDTSLAWPPFNDRELRLACVAALHWPKKGQDLLFEALAGPAWKERAWKLSLYGEGVTKQVLQHLALELGLSDRIKFAGFRPVTEIWANNHVLIMPSRFEGLPLAMVEAMLCARPVIATDVAGHADLIEDGVTGFLAEAPTPKAIAAALERFWDRRHQAEEIGKAAERKIRELVPPDAISEFAEKLKNLATLI